MEKVCKRCGKIAQMMSWEDYCYACLIQNELERVQLNVREAKEDEDPDTYSTDYVICPYCGCEMPTDLSYCIVRSWFHIRRYSDVHDYLPDIVG